MPGGGSRGYRNGVLPLQSFEGSGRGEGRNGAYEQVMPVGISVMTCRRGGKVTHGTREQKILLGSKKPSSSNGEIGRRRIKGPGMRPDGRKFTE